MDEHTEANVTRIADDIHFLSAPFRLLWRLVGIFIGIAFAPAILLWLMLSEHFEAERYAECMQRVAHFSGCTPPEFGITKVLIGVLGPMVFCIWFAGVVRWLERNDPRYPIDLEGSERASGLAAYFCGVGWIGVIASMAVSAYFDLSGEGSVWMMVLGLFSPAILYGFGRALRNS